MAARKHQAHQSAVRERIKVSQLLNRLQKNALGELEAPLTRDQIKCIEILLAKAIPDLKSIEHTGEGGGPIKTEIAWATSAAEAVQDPSAAS